MCKKNRRRLLYVRYFQDLFIVIMRCVFPTKRAPFHHRYFGKVSQQVPLPERDKNYRKTFYFLHCKSKEENNSKAELNRFHSLELKAYIIANTWKIHETILQSKKNSSHFIQKHGQWCWNCEKSRWAMYHNTVTLFLSTSLNS